MQPRVSQTSTCEYVRNSLRNEQGIAVLDCVFTNETSCRHAGDQVAVPHLAVWQRRLPDLTCLHTVSQNEEASKGMWDQTGMLIAADGAVERMATFWSAGSHSTQSER